MALKEKQTADSSFSVFIKQMKITSDSGMERFATLIYLIFLIAAFLIAVFTNWKFIWI